jgi:hypothetical protein
MYIHIASRTPRPKKTSNLQYRDNFRVVAERSLQWLLRAAFRCKAEKLRRLPECTSSGKFYSSYSYRRYRSLKVTWSYYASIRFNAPTSFPEQMRAYQFRMPPRRFLPIVEKLTQDGFLGFSPVRLDSNGSWGRARIGTHMLSVQPNAGLCFLGL